MPTTTTIGLARDALISAINTGDLQDKVFYAWPGPEIAKGYWEAAWIDTVLEWTQQIPTLKTGRKQRQERYVFELVLWVAKPEVGSLGAKATFDRALELLAIVENALADDVQLGDTNIQWMAGISRTVDLIPHEKGWATQLVVRIEGNARLT